MLKVACSFVVKIRNNADTKRLSQIGKTKSDSSVFKDLVRKKKNRRQKLTAESMVMLRSVKNRPLFTAPDCFMNLAPFLQFSF